MSNNLIGTDPNQVPSNADLGTLAYQDAGDVTVENLKIGTANFGTTPSAWLTVVKDNDNSGNQVVIADAEGASAGIRSYAIPGSSGDPAGLILNHYYAQSGSGNQYMRYADLSLTWVVVLVLQCALSLRIRPIHIKLDYK